VSGLTVIVSVPLDLGSFVGRARMQTNLSFLLRTLIRRLEDIGDTPNPAGDRLVGFIEPELGLCRRLPPDAIVCHQTRSCSPIASVTTPTGVSPRVFQGCAVCSRSTPQARTGRRVGTAPPR
jgi:hypothetical protein